MKRVTGWVRPDSGAFPVLTAYYVRTYGAQPEDFGKLCVAQRANALQFPYALFKKPLSMEDYRNARWVSRPFETVFRDRG